MDKNKDRIEANKYNIIYADPPWRFKNWSMTELAKRGEKWARRNGRSPYDVMNHDDICALDVTSIAARNSVLLMWATYPKLEESFEVIFRMFLLVPKNAIIGNGKVKCGDSTGFPFEH
jgi:N6-adenosine-specific RNA methylase IME4